MNLISQSLLELLHLLSNLSIHLLHVLPHRIILLWYIQPAEHNMFTPGKFHMCQSFAMAQQTKVWQADAASANMPDSQCESCKCTLMQVLESRQGLEPEGHAGAALQL